MMEAPISAPAQGGSGWFINHLPDILWQRRIYIISAFALALTAAVIAAFSLPTMYRSTATMLVQSQDLPTQIVDSPVSSAIDQRIARIRERVLSRGDLVSLIEQNDLYESERRSKPLSQVVEKMRKATSVSALQNDIGNNAASQQSNTIAVTMSFDYREPAKAQAVLQSYVSNFLRLDNDDLEDQANISVRFLQDQASKLQSQIREIEGQLTALKARNGSALAISAPPTMDTGGYTAQIAALESQNRQLLAQSRRGPQKDPLLAQAEAAYAAARATYNDSHPDVAVARERVEQLRSISRSNPADDDNAIIREQIAANNAAIASLSNARNSAVARAGAAAAGQARAPAILEQAMQLENRVGALREQYREVATNLLKAQNSARMTSEQRAERLQLVEPPEFPDRPFWPNRPLLIGAGAAAGLFLGLLLALGIELMGRPVRSPAQLENLGLPVLGVVPTLPLKAKPRRAGFFRKRVRAVAG